MRLNQNEFRGRRLVNYLRLTLKWLISIGFSAAFILANWSFTDWHGGGILQIVILSGFHPFWFSLDVTLLLASMLAGAALFNPVIQQVIPLPHSSWRRNGLALAIVASLLAAQTYAAQRHVAEDSKQDVGQAD